MKQAILFSFLIICFTTVGHTGAFYNDIESSDDNIFATGEVDFTLTTSDFSSSVASVNLGIGDTILKTITVVPGDSNPFKYVATTINFAGDDDFCEALVINNPALTETTDFDPLTFSVNDGLANFENKVCSFDIEFRGSQTRHDLNLGEGYSDVEITENKVASWGFRLNKVYYDVAPDRGVEGQNEWVEIYNQTNTALDVSGWEICDDTLCETIPLSPAIPSQGFGVITPATSTWNYWQTPSTVVKIALGGTRIGNSLDNNADMLILRRPDGVIIDQMNWGIPNGSWPNTNDQVWNPGVADVAEGGTLARKPNGFDTNQPSDWVALMPPTVDLITPDEDTYEVWFWGADYQISWLATNPNGDDDDLKIRLSYIKDLNQDHVISQGDQEILIADNLNNDDSPYIWIVPDGFIGYIWIKVVVTGPENPMLNATTISGDIWDPVPVFSLPNDPATIRKAISDLAEIDPARVGRLSEVLGEEEKGKDVKDQKSDTVMPVSPVETESLEIEVESSTEEIITEEVVTEEETEPDFVETPPGEEVIEEIVIIVDGEEVEETTEEEVVVEESVEVEEDVVVEEEVVEVEIPNE